MPSFPYKHVVVVGVTGSGKSTFAERLAKHFNLKYIELDALYWEPNWQAAPLAVFRNRVEEITQTEKWIVAGNYHVVRDITWSRAEAIVWLDYSLWRVFWQLTGRILTRWWSQELLWGTNREPLWGHFKLWSKDSLCNWLFQTYWRRRREYPALLAQPEHQHLKLMRFKNPKETEIWLRGLYKRGSPLSPHPPRRNWTLSRTKRSHPGIDRAWLCWIGAGSPRCLFRSRFLCDRRGRA